MRATETQDRAVLATLPRLPGFQRITQRIFESLVRGVCRVWCPLRVVGRENLPAAPFLICANHTSHMDSIVLMIAAGKPFRRFATLAASDYFFGSKLRRAGFNCLLNLVPLDRSAQPPLLRTTLSLCAEFLNQGDHSLILFPEGTRSVTGEIGPFKRASAVFSTQLQLPVVPVCIEGTARVMPKGSFFPKPGEISVTIGEPLWPLDGDSIMHEVRSRILAMRRVLTV